MAETRAVRPLSVIHDPSGASGDIWAVPDYDDNIERAVLGAVMLDYDACKLAMGWPLTEEHFLRDRNRAVFAAISESYDVGETPDIILVNHRLTAKNQTNIVGGISYLAELYDRVLTTKNVEHYVRQLDRLRLRRKRVLGAAEVMTHLRRGADDEAVIALESTLHAASRSVTLVPAAQQTADLCASFDLETETGIVGLSTGLSRLDRITGGLCKTRQYLLAAPPSVGKTSLAMQIGLNVALAGNRVHIFSNEMGYVDLRRRLTSSLSGVPLPPGALKRLSDTQRVAVYRSARELGQLPLTVDGRGLPLHEMVAYARRVRGSVDLYIVDYLQIVEVEGVTELTPRVAAVSRTMKKIAMELEVPMLVLSQLSRSNAQDGQKEREELHNLFGSGALEQDANVVAFLRRGGYTKVESDDNSAMLTVKKNRDGCIGQVPLLWDKRLARFDEGEVRGDAH